MRILAIMLLLLLAAQASAQVNTEALRLSRRESGLSGNISVSFSIDLGNSNLTEFEMNPDLVWRGGRHRVFSINELTSISTDSGSILNKGFSHLRYNFDPTRKYIPELFLQAQYDHSRKLSQRYLAGGGLRIVAVRAQNFFLAFGITGMYEREELSTGEITNIARASDYVSVKMKKKDLLTYSFTLYVQPAISDIEDVRILFGSELSVAISKRLSLKTELEYLHDSKPPEDTKQYDLSIDNGLRFSF